MTDLDERQLRQKRRLASLSRWMKLRPMQPLYQKCTQCEKPVLKMFLFPFQRGRRYERSLNHLVAGVGLFQT